MVDRYQCTECLILIDDADLIDVKCPVCLSDKSLKPLCPGDHICRCPDTNNYQETYCPICGARTCPCGSHDITIISRITGYMSDLSAWNAAKRQEFEDRQRYDAVGVNK